MPSETLFLQPTEPTADPNPNFAEASGNSRFFNYSQSASGSLTSTEAKALVDGELQGQLLRLGQFLLTLQRLPSYLPKAVERVKREPSISKVEVKRKSLPILKLKRIKPFPLTLLPI